MMDICNERHKKIDKILEEHDQKLDRLDRSDATNTQAINDLTRSISGQTKAIWGLVSIATTALIGFFFYAVEKGLFK